MALGAPNFLKVIDAYEAGADRRERSRLQELSEQGRMLTGQALQGNQNALAQLGGVDANAYMQVKQFGDAEKKQFVQDFARQAYAVQSPEQWQSLISGYKAQGRSFSPEEEKFENRQLLISKAIDLGDQMGLDLRREESARDQRNSDRTYGLQVRNQQGDETYRREQLAIEKAKLGAAGPDLVELFDDKTGQPYKAKYNPQTGGFDRVGGIKAPSGTSLEVGPDGQVTFTQGMGKPLTEGQSKDTAYLTRMTEAVPLVDKMGETLTSFGENVGASVPLVGNYLKSPEYQQAEQAAGQWRQAFLRKDSGATITKEETADTNSLYIPQPGDKAPVLAQKAKARRTATLAVKLGLPPKAVMEMQKAGVDVDKILGAPLPGESGKSDQQPRRRRYNPATDSLE